MNIQGKTALVTGASRGIGRAIAIELAHHRIQKVLLIARDRRSLAEVVAELESLGVEAIALPLDLTQPVEINIAIAQAWRDHGPIHLLVNCAGIAYQVPFVRAHLSQMQEEIAVNLVGMYAITRLMARRMVAQRQGQIVNVSSLMGQVAAPTFATYSATKFAILGFTQALRSELAPHNVRVTALLPSLTETDMVRNFQRFRGVVPTTPEKVAQALIAGLQKDSSTILVGWQSHVVAWCSRLAPGLIERIMQMTRPLPAATPRTWPI
jgi:3-oxoacyl-[acyl-carrier protein] reductase